MHKQNDTLVILTPGFPANEADCTCLPPQQIFVKALKKNYPQLNIVVLAFQYPFCKAVYSWFNVSVVSLNGKNKGKIHRLLLWRKVWTSLEEIRRKNKIIGILNFWLGECALVGSFFAKRHHLKHYTWMLGQDAKSSNKYHRLIKPRPQNLIALSNFISAEYFKNYDAHPQHVIPVGLDTSLFPSVMVKRDIDVMGAGSLIALKRYDLFINIVKEIVVYVPTLTVVICGKGDEKRRLEDQVIRNRLEGNISLIGEVPHEEVLKLMQRSKVFLHTSSFEGYGAVCAEALYAGAHVVSFCNPMNRNFWHYNFVEAKEQAVKIITEILTDEDREHTSILTDSIDDVCKQMMELFAV
jgi:glycosyltransferase involved in cell wall biosynthesis